MANFIRVPCANVTASPKLPIRIKPSCEKWVLVATILGSSMAFIDGTIVNVILPTLQESLHASISQIQWIIEAYALTLATLLLVGGALGDIYGRRKIFLIGIVIFTLTSVWCGLAFSITSLVIARTLQGMGAALLVPGSLALISASFPEETRGRAIGTWAGWTAIMTALGPLAGGFLSEYVSWRWAFFINLPLAITVFIVSLFFIPESKDKYRSSQLDWQGALLATIGLGAIVFALIEWQYDIRLVMLTFITGFLILVGFFWVEMRTSSPLVPLQMFHSRHFSGTNLITFFLYFALNGFIFFLPLDLIQVQGYKPTEAGAAMLPLILLMFLLSRSAGGLVKRFGPRLPLVVGPTIAAIGFALFLRSGIGQSYWLSFFPATFILGLGLATSVAPLTTVVMNSVAIQHVGAASGINNAISRIAGLLAIAVLGLIMTVVFNQQLFKHLESSSLASTKQQEIFDKRAQLAAIKTDDEQVHRMIQESFTSGFNIIALIAAALALTSAICAALIITDKTPQVIDKKNNLS